MIKHVTALSNSCEHFCKTLLRFPSSEVPSE
jgi:hypothetical protein